MTDGKAALAALVGLALTVSALGGCASVTPSTSVPAAAPKPKRVAATTTSPSTIKTKTTRASTRPRTARASALAALKTLPIKGRAPKTGYSREQFGDGWLTVGGCDTGDRILERDLTRETMVGGGSCEVERGQLNDPYTAAAITYVRGGASEVDVDHVVALGDAWQKGAQQWSPERRVAFANDPLELLSVDSSANRQKGDGDAATWLPANKSFRCDYVARQIAVKRKYGAWVTQAEHDAMARVLTKCPNERLPTSGRIRVPVIATHRAPAKHAAPSSTQTATPAPSSTRTATPAPSRHGRVFANCTAVRAAGLAPLRRGTPDYAANPNLDRDHDGLACE